MELSELKSRNFKPRDNLEELAKEHIREEVRKVPADGIVKGTIVDEGNSFAISMVAKVGNKIFNAESHHLKEKLTGAPRLWQLAAIKLVLKDLINQIKKTLKLD